MEESLAISLLSLNRDIEYNLIVEITKSTKSKLNLILANVI